ncbi:membrane associated rhomboid family serine protease [Mucilaginibacter gracilis]|uniref:Membrane associated rhomboid family serine protease n=1 Tax=Mucilaginibacter gracilis TaxID=423350 RepID=A0A495JB55_9SPHI|nr:rhomboid family intramembrane serine protease [Mucilaginibacter gracilis]RKR85289.1 membrane associated rhomboid family serine protease [Mucilaginibacter gracilis]
MSTIWEEIRFKVIHSGRKVNLLIGINVAVFLVLGIVYVFELLITRQDFFHDLIVSYLALPSSLPKLLTRFWTPVTYMFMHDGIFHILFNMLWFFWIGQIFEEYLGGKKLLTIYFFGGLAGAFFYVAAYNLFPLFSEVKAVSTVVGASACVMATIVGTATLLPNYSIYLMFLGEVKLKWIAIVYVVFDFLSIVGPNAGGELAHLGGALIGFIYVRQLNRGNDWGDGISKLFKSRSKLKVVVKNSAGSVSSKPRQDEIDNILDKISKVGYDSLSKQEKETLFRASKDDRS